MGVINIKSNKLRPIALLIILFGAVYFLFVFNNEYTVKHILYKEIQIKQISNTQMSKKVYSKAGGIGYVRTEDIILNEEDIENIIYWINSASESEITKLDQISTNNSISAGIVFRLKASKEIRIQYDLEKIYITRTDIKNRQIFYSINQEELKNFFDKHLKGLYSGEDKVEASDCISRSPHII